MLRFLDDLLNIHKFYSKQMVGQIYPMELHLNKAYSIETEAPFQSREPFSLLHHSVLI